MEEQNCVFVETSTRFNLNGKGSRAYVRGFFFLFVLRCV